MDRGIMTGTTCTIGIERATDMAGTTGTANVDVAGMGNAARDSRTRPRRPRCTARPLRTARPGRTPAGAPCRWRAFATTLALVLSSTLLLAAGGCASTQSGDRATSEPAVKPAAFPVTVTDDASRTVEIASEPERIVSLAPANTEIVSALGLEDRLVGVTTYCDYPPSVAGIAKMGDFVTPNIEAIGAADPDLVVATTGVQAEILKQLEDLGAVVIAIDPATLDGLYEDIETIGRATGATAEAREVVESMKRQVEEVRQAVQAEPVSRAFVEIGQNPLFTVGSGTLIDEMLRIAGGKNIVSQPGYVAYSLEQLVKDDPDVYMATKGSMSDPSDLKQRAGYGRLSAARAGRVYVLDDNLVTRPGPRLVEGIRSMAEAMHPESFR